MNNFHEQLQNIKNQENQYAKTHKTFFLPLPYKKDSENKNAMGFVDDWKKLEMSDAINKGLLWN